MTPPNLEARYRAALTSARAALQEAELMASHLREARLTAVQMALPALANGDTATIHATQIALRNAAPDPNALARISAARANLSALPESVGTFRDNDRLHVLRQLERAQKDLDVLRSATDGIREELWLVEESPGGRLPAVKAITDRFFASINAEEVSPGSLRILIADAQGEEVLAYAQRMVAAGHDVTVTNPLVADEARIFESLGCRVIPCRVDQIPDGRLFHFIREDFPQATGAAQEFLTARAAHLEPGGFYVTASDSQSARQLVTAAESSNLTAQEIETAVFHEGTPRTPAGQVAERIAVFQMPGPSSAPGSPIGGPGSNLAADAERRGAALAGQSLAGTAETVVAEAAEDTLAATERAAVEAAARRVPGAAIRALISEWIPGVDLVMNLMLIKDVMVLAGTVLEATVGQITGHSEVTQVVTAGMRASLDDLPRQISAHADAIAAAERTNTAGAAWARYQVTLERAEPRGDQGPPSWQLVDASPPTFVGHPVRHMERSEHDGSERMTLVVSVPVNQEAADADHDATAIDATPPQPHGDAGVPAGTPPIPAYPDDQSADHQAGYPPGPINVCLNPGQDGEPEAGHESGVHEIAGRGDATATEPEGHPLFGHQDAGVTQDSHLAHASSDVHRTPAHVDSADLNYTGADGHAYRSDGVHLDPKDPAPGQKPIGDAASLTPGDHGEPGHSPGPITVCLRPDQDGESMNQHEASNAAASEAIGHFDDASD